MREIDSDTKRAIIGSEITMWSNTRYQMKLRYRVQKAIGGSAEQLKVLEDELVKCETALDELENALKELDNRP